MAIFRRRLENWSGGSDSHRESSASDADGIAVALPPELGGAGSELLGVFILILELILRLQIRYESESH